MGTGYHGGFGDSKGNNEQEDKTTENESEDNSIFNKTTIDSNYQTLKDDYPLTKEGKFGEKSEHCRIIKTEDPVKTSSDFYTRLGKGGIIAVDKFGNLTLTMNTAGMFRAFANSKGEQKISIFKE